MDVAFRVSSTKLVNMDCTIGDKGRSQDDLADTKQQTFVPQSCAGESAMSSLVGLLMAGAT